MYEFKTWSEGENSYFRSPEYNWDLNNVTGKFVRYGKSMEDDPQFSEYGPEILDLECTTKCSGGCKECYKSNTENGKNMSLETFKNIIKKVNPFGNLKQVAFGLDSTGEANPDLWKMCEYLRENGITPNGTIANINEDTARKIAKYFGAVAISFHKNFKDPFNLVANQVDMLRNLGMDQINIHFVLYRESLDDLKILINLIKTDSRFKHLKSIVLLSLKIKGRAVNHNFHRLSPDEFKEVVYNLLDENISFGFDSCSACSFIKAIEEKTDLRPELKAAYLSAAEPCESKLFSLYVDVDELAYPCSFSTEHEQGYLITDGFLTWWNSDRWRRGLLSNGRSCPIFHIHCY